MQADTPVQANWRQVQSQLEAAAQSAGRNAPRLIAVSKRQPVQSIRELLIVGQKDFGENYVQEATDKIAQLADHRAHLTWHLIGHLQSNKAAIAASQFDWIHTIDRQKLLEPLQTARQKLTRTPLNLLIQVNIDDEDSKSGCASDEVDSLADAIAQCPNLRLRGLMTIGAIHDDPSESRPTFRRMQELFAGLHRKHPSADTLSMGMSGDYPLAIAEGSTMVRVGTAIFGARH